MDDFITTIETFLTYSDDKLTELAEKNKALKLDVADTDDPSDQT